MNIITKQLDQNDRRALKHAKKDELWKALQLIELCLHRKTFNGMNDSEKYISDIVSEYTHHLYFAK